TGAAKVLDQGGGNWLLTVDSIESVSESFATDQTATSSTEGSTLKNVVLNGVNLGDVSESMDFTIQDPAAHRRIDVRLLQKVRVGAAAGDPVPDPVAGVIVSGVTVNGIRVTVRDVTDPASPVVEADIIVARADTRVDRFNQTTCVAESPAVSGSGYVLNVDADELAIDPDRQLTRTRIADVVLPSHGGRDRAHLDHSGPILDSSGNLFLESKTAFSDTEGQINGASADSSTVSAIEELGAFDQGEGPQLTADTIRAECTSSSDAQRSTGKTTLAGLTLGGSDLCEELQLGPACTPEPNTRFTNDPNLDVILNEQKADPAAAGCTGITVNAIHIHALGSGNSIGLPAGADVIISNAHCDACRE
ncbi:MAG: choice-of-anchor P family protein, partial [Candidatus Binatia bacterium]